MINNGLFKSNDEAKNGKKYSKVGNVNMRNKSNAELPVIPKAVAAYIKKCKHDGIAIASAMDEDKFPKKVADYFRTYYTRDQWIELQDTFARAWLDGFQKEAKK